MYNIALDLYYTYNITILQYYILYFQYYTKYCGEPPSHSGPLYSSIFDNSRENNGQATFVTFAPRLYNLNHYNHAHAPGPHMGPTRSPGPWPHSKCSKTVEVTPSAPKQWKSDVRVKG